MSDQFPAIAPNMILRYGAIPKGNESFVICGMFTPSHDHFAKRLVASLSRLNLPHALFEVPAVHRSISTRGTSDPTYTKANFIWHVLELAKRPVLYLDVDCVIRQPPDLIYKLINDGHDFAILNWLALDSTDAYYPMVETLNDGNEATSDRYFMYSHHLNWATQEQLICSGAVHVWGRTSASAALLGGWHSTILTGPRVADDKCLDFAFNNQIGGWRNDLRPFWLPKPYARYAWWIFDEPIIDHPEIPNSGDWAEIQDNTGRMGFYPERAAIRTTQPLVPRDCVIDTKTGLLLTNNQQMTVIGRLTQKLWV